MEWEPVLEKTESIENLLGEIAEVLSRYRRIDDTIGLLGGSFGVTLFLLYYSLLKKTDTYQDNVHNIISDTFDSINQGQTVETFCDGIAGVGWGMQHLVKQDMLEFDSHELQNSISKYLRKCMISAMQNNGKYDYLHGAVGIGIYFLDTNTKLAKKYVEELIMLLDKVSIKEGESIKWKSDIINVGTVYNFSLSHGMASILIFLVKAHKKGVAQNMCLKLINGTVHYLLSKKIEYDSYSVFPSYIGLDGTIYKNSPLSWCYGDLGTSLSLWFVAEATNNELLKHEVVNIFLSATERNAFKEKGVWDAGICHGSAGIAHIFNRMYNYTKVERFRETSQFWFDKTLKMRTFPDGLAGYKAWYSEDYGGWQNKASLLVGISGIGLALISAISDIEPKWDECLLLS